MSVLIHSPSSGLNEVLTGLLKIGHGGATAQDLKRHYFGPRVTQSDISDVLATLAGLSYVTAVGSRYTLTLTGAARAHAKRSTRYASCY